MQKKIYLGLLLAVFLVAVVFIVRDREEPANHYEESGTGTYTENGAMFQRVRSEDLGVSFAYRTNPNGYALTESTSTAPEPIHTYLLMLQKDIDEINASEGLPREGPPVIVLRIYANPEYLSAADWTRAHSQETYTTGDTALTETMLGGAPAVSFHTDGLYQISNIVADNNGEIYFLLGEYDSPEDQIAKDFSALTNTHVLF